MHSLSVLFGSLDGLGIFGKATLKILCLCLGIVEICKQVMVTCKIWSLVLLGVLKTAPGNARHVCIAWLSMCMDTQSVITTAVLSHIQFLVNNNKQPRANRE